MYCIRPSPMFQERHIICMLGLSLSRCWFSIFPMWLEGRLSCSIEVQLVRKLSVKFIRSQHIFSIYPSPMIQERYIVCVLGMSLSRCWFNIFPMWLEGRLPCSIEVQLVRKLSGKFIRSQQIFFIYPSPMIQERHIICALGMSLSRCWYNICFQCDWKVGWPSQ
jgi:hypothetical protein